jgi:hypothetical protein
VETASTSTAAMETAAPAKPATSVATSASTAPSRGNGRRQNGNRTGCQ